MAIHPAVKRSFYIKMVEDNSLIAPYIDKVQEEGATDEHLEALYRPFNHYYLGDPLDHAQSLRDMRAFPDEIALKLYYAIHAEQAMKDPQLAGFIREVCHLELEPKDTARRNRVIGTLTQNNNANLTRWRAIFTDNGLHQPDFDAVFLTRAGITPTQIANAPREAAPMPHIPHAPEADELPEPVHIPRPRPGNYNALIERATEALNRLGYANGDNHENIATATRAFEESTMPEAEYTQRIRAAWAEQAAYYLDHLSRNINNPTDREQRAIYAYRQAHIDETTYTARLRTAWEELARRLLDDLGRDIGIAADREKDAIAAFVKAGFNPTQYNEPIRAAWEENAASQLRHLSSDAGIPEEMHKRAVTAFAKARVKASDYEPRLRAAWAANAQKQVQYIANDTGDPEEKERLAIIAFKHAKIEPDIYTKALRKAWEDNARKHVNSYLAHDAGDPFDQEKAALIAFGKAKTPPDTEELRRAWAANARKYVGYIASDIGDAPDHEKQAIASFKKANIPPEDYAAELRKAWAANARKHLAYLSGECSSPKDTEKEAVDAFKRADIPESSYAPELLKAWEKHAKVTHERLKTGDEYFAPGRRAAIAHATTRVEVLRDMVPEQMIARAKAMFHDIRDHKIPPIPTDASTGGAVAIRSLLARANAPSHTLSNHTTNDHALATAVLDWADAHVRLWETKKIPGTLADKQQVEDAVHFAMNLDREISVHRTRTIQERLDRLTHDAKLDDVTTKRMQHSNVR